MDRETYPGMNWDSQRGISSQALPYGWELLWN